MSRIHRHESCIDWHGVEHRRIERRVVRHDVFLVSFLVGMPLIQSRVSIFLFKDGLSCARLARQGRSFETLRSSETPVQREMTLLRKVF